MKLKNIRLPIKGRDKRISLRKWYLVKYDGVWSVGKFSRQWYGLNFGGIYDSGIQVDYAEWQKCYEIIP